MQVARAGTRTRAGARVALALGAALLAASGASIVRASSGNEGAPEPGARGLRLLEERAASLATQSQQSWAHARARGLLLYRLLRVRALAGGDGARGAAGSPSGGQALSLATAVLVRDLDEAHTLREEVERVREERAALASAPATPPSILARAATGTPATHRLRMVSPVTAPLAVPFGVTRDSRTGAWLFRAAASFRPSSRAEVRAPAAGRVVSVTNGVAGGTAVVLDGGDGWTVILDGIDRADVRAGDVVARGAPLGVATAGAPGAVRPIELELWRGRTPVDPSDFLPAPIPARAGAGD